jgi:hypothetical protein
MGLRYSSSSLLIIIPICFLPSVAHAQPRTPQFPSPPPMRFVARDDRSQLTLTKDAKARVRVTIELADSRLNIVEQLTQAKQFEQASEALGKYLGLIEDAKSFIASLTQDKNSTRDLYRRLDIALRGQIPRLVVMRRSTPADYAVHLKAAEEFARDTRTEALESFYGQTVLRESANTEKKADAIKNNSPDNKRP